MKYKQKLSYLILVVAAVIGGLSMLAILSSSSLAQTEAESWLAEGDPSLDIREISPNYSPPYSTNYNTDCDTRSFNVVIREARTFPLPRLTEKRHTSNCAVMTARGMADSEYLDAGDPAGKFTGMAGRINPIPNSFTLLALHTQINSISLKATFFETIVPEENLNNGELYYKVRNPSSLLAADGKEYTIRPSSYAFSRNGNWMIAESNGLGYIRININTKEVRPFGPRVSPSSGSMNKYVAISEDGRFAAVALSGGRFKVYDIAACDSDPSVIANCPHKDIEPVLKEQLPGYSLSYYIRFASSEMLTFVASARDQEGVLHKYRVRMAPSGHEITNVNYLALGDSFSSGEGAYDYEPGTDEPENMCHLSRSSYPYLVAGNLGFDDFRSVACSGAKTNHYYIDAQSRTLVPSYILPGEIGQRQYLERHHPNVVTISMIGNDIGFSNKLTKCIAGADSCFHFREDRQSVAAEIADKFDTLVNMYKNIKESANNDDIKIYVLGYPQLFNPDLDECGLNVRLDKEERKFSRGLVSYLNAVIKAATQKAGVMYIDVQNAFDGYLLCDPAQKAVNGLTAGGDMLKVIGNESYHPNSFGHQLFAAALEEQSLGLSIEMPLPDETKTAPGENSSEYQELLGDAPWGSNFKRLKYTSLSGLELVVRGKNMAINQLDNFMPDTPVDIWFYSEPVHAGSLQSDERGFINGEVTVPSSLPPGFHTIHIVGKDLANKEQVLYKTIYVAASEEDYDGDGVLNSDEQCLAVEPSGEDIDRDGVDDACDGEITDPPADTTQPIVTGMPERQPNSEGWYNKEVAINWEAHDPEPSSGQPSQPEPTIASKEGVHIYQSSESCDPLQNCSTGQLEISLDKTAPEIVDLALASKTQNGSAKVNLKVVDTVSGPSSAEYYIGEIDPGVGQGIPLNIEEGQEDVVAEFELSPGLHVVTFRVKDKAGNWSKEKQLEVAIEGSSQLRVIGAGVVLPVFQDNNFRGIEHFQINLNTTQDYSGRHNTFKFKREASILCRIFTPSNDCGKLELKMTALEWLVPAGDSQDLIVQGIGSLSADGQKTTSRFRMFIKNRLTIFDSRILLQIYHINDTPLTDQPLSQIDRENILGGIVAL